MEKAKAYEDYPGWNVLAVNAFSFAIWIAGAYIIWLALGIWVSLYIAFLLALEVRLIGGHCRDCYYYGKWCANGAGKLSSLFFKKGNPANFCRKNMTLKDILPSFMVSLIPMAIGAWMVIMSFSWIIVELVALLLVMSFPGNAFMHGKLICRNCRQRELGCPAEKMFSGKK